MNPENDHVHVATTSDGVGWITFDNPSKANALSARMWAGLASALSGFEVDPSVHVVVLAGAGEKAFCAGADISQFEQARSSPDASAAYDCLSKGTIARLQAFPKPTVAMIRGWCLGAGVGLAAACDLRVAADDARFGVPSARLGIGYFQAGVKRLVDLAGPSQAKRMLYTGERYGAPEMWRIGLVDELVTKGELADRVASIAAGIAANAPLSIAAAKAFVDMSCGDLSPDPAACAALERACVESDDHVEGRRAFLEKRAPIFRGR